MCIFPISVNLGITNLLIAGRVQKGGDSVEEHRVYRQHRLSGALLKEA